MWVRLFFLGGRSVLLVFLVLEVTALVTHAQDFISDCVQQRAELSVFLNPAVNFTQALTACADIGLLLARLDDATIYSTVRNFLSSSGNPNNIEVWVGILSNKTDPAAVNTVFDFFYTDDVGNQNEASLAFLQSPNANFPWGFGKPDNSGNDNLCGSMVVNNNFALDDVDCTSLRGFVCRRDCTPTASPTLSPTEFAFFQQKGNVIGISLVGVAGGVAMLAVVFALMVYRRRAANNRESRKRILSMPFVTSSDNSSPKSNLRKGDSDFDSLVPYSTPKVNFDRIKVKQTNLKDVADMPTTGVLSVERVMATNPSGQFDPNTAHSKMLLSANPKSSYLSRIFKGMSAASIFRPSDDYINKAEVKKHMKYANEGIAEFAPKNQNRKKRGRAKRGHISDLDEEEL